MSDKEEALRRLCMCIGGKRVAGIIRFATILDISETISDQKIAEFCCQIEWQCRSFDHAFCFFLALRFSLNLSYTKFFFFFFFFF